MNNDVIFEYNAVKNEQLKGKRGISFKEIIHLIQSGSLLDVIQHPNKSKYEN